MHVFLGITLVLLSQSAIGLELSGSIEQKGRQLAFAVDHAANDGFGDLSASLRMILQDQRGRRSERHLVIKVLEGVGDGDRVLTVFERPHDVKGTALLTWAHPGTSDDQWLFLPGLKRVKRIHSENKSGPFMGSEFAYEDFTTQEVEDFLYKFVSADSDEFVFERRPVDKNSGYTRQVVSIHKPTLRIERIDYFDRKASLLKTLTLEDYQLYLDRYWRPRKMTMTNHQTGRSTSLLWDTYRFRVGLDESRFTHTALRYTR